MQQHLEFYIVDSFTRTRYQGNPAGVVISTASIPDQTCMKIAGELHLETAFLWPSTGNGSTRASTAAPSPTYAISYFTQLARVPLCGHDTIAAGVVLAQRGEIDETTNRMVFQSDIGDLPIEILPDGSVSMRQSIPRYAEPCDMEEILTALGLKPEKVINVPSRVVSTGTPFLFVGVDSVRSVDGLMPDMILLTRALNRLPVRDVLGVYVWADDRVGASQSIYGRCFAPVAGLPEDPVTGSASGALAAHLFDCGKLRSTAGGLATLRTTQGNAMGRPGNVDVTLIASGGHVNSVVVAGPAVIVAQGTLWV